MHLQVCFLLVSLAADTRACAGLLIISLRWVLFHVIYIEFITLFIAR